MFLTFNEIVDDMLLFMMDEATKRSIRRLAEEDLIRLNEHLSLIIAKRYKLYDIDNPLTLLNYVADVIVGVDVNPKRPENVTLDLLHSFWKRLQ